MGVHARTGIDVLARAWEHTLAYSNTPPSRALPCTPEPQRVPEQHQKSHPEVSEERLRRYLRPTLDALGPV